MKTITSYRFLIVMAGIIVFGLGVLGVLLTPEGSRTQPALRVTQGSIAIAKPPKPPKPFYGFIRGGVHGVAEFREALRRDPALAGQFLGFDWSKARFETLEQSYCAYIAYRRDSEFAWASKCRMLYAGELILTDGHYRIRAVCGNLISDIPEVPVIPQDTEPVALDIPVTPVTPDLTPSDSVATGPSSPTPPPVDVPLSPLTPTPIGLCCGFVPKPTTVPEGDNFLDAMVCVFSVLVLGIYWRKP